EVECRLRPDEIDCDVGAGTVREFLRRARSFFRVNSAVCATVESGLARFLFQIDCEDSGSVSLCDLNRRKADPTGSDDDDEVSLLRLTERHDRAVGGGAAVGKRGRDGDIHVRRQRENRRLLRHDKLRVATGLVEAERGPLFTEVRPLAATLAAPAARLGATATAKYPKYVRARARGFRWREPKA